MRAPILGWEIDDPAMLTAFLEVSTTMTHTDPKALIGALAVARTVQLCRRNPAPSRAELIKLWRAVDPLPAWQEVVDAVENSASITEVLAATRQKKGIGGYIFHTVPACLFIAEKHRGNFRAAIEETILAGGDTDTAAAIVAALCVGFGGTPPREWVASIVDYPIRQEPSLARFGWNLVCTLLIFVWHILKRLLRI